MGRRHHGAAAPGRVLHRIRCRFLARVPARFRSAPSAATASAPATLPPGAFTSKLHIPSFTGSCPATTVPSASGRTVVIPLHILTPSAVISQLFVGVCLNGHGPYPFIIDTGSTTPTSTSPWPAGWA